LAVLVEKSGEVVGDRGRGSVLSNISLGALVSQPPVGGHPHIRGCGEVSPVAQIESKPASP